MVLGGVSDMELCSFRLCGMMRYHAGLNWMLWTVLGDAGDAKWF